MDIEKYQELAWRTAKLMDAPQMLVHGALGIGSEHGELCEAQLASVENAAAVREEIGDSLWFNAYIRSAIGATFDWQILRHRALEVTDWALPRHKFAVEAVAVAGEIQTLIKAAVFYAKPLDTSALLEQLDRLAALQVGFCATQNLRIEDVLAANIAKLAVRYPAKFSEELAVARADKAALRCDFAPGGV